MFLRFKALWGEPVFFFAVGAPGGGQRVSQLARAPAAKKNVPRTLDVFLQWMLGDGGQQVSE